MLAKYRIEYAIPLHGHEHENHCLTDDPVTCQEYLADMLTRGLHIKEILHEGVPLPLVEFYQMVKTAAHLVATRLLCTSLKLDPAEAHHHFGPA